MSGLDRSGDNQPSIEQQKRVLAARLERLRDELRVLQEELQRNNTSQLQLGESQKEEVKAMGLLGMFEEGKRMLQEKIASKTLMISACERELSELSSGKKIER